MIGADFDDYVPTSVPQTAPLPSASHHSTIPSRTNPESAAIRDSGPAHVAKSSLNDDSQRRENKGLGALSDSSSSSSSSDSSDSDSDAENIPVPMPTVTTNGAPYFSGFNPH